VSAIDYVIQIGYCTSAVHCQHGPLFTVVSLIDRFTVTAFPIVCHCFGAHQPTTHQY